MMAKCYETESLPDKAQVQPFPRVRLGDRQPECIYPSNHSRFAMPHLISHSLSVLACSSRKPDRALEHLLICQERALLLRLECFKILATFRATYVPPLQGIAVYSARNSAPVAQ